MAMLGLRTAAILCLLVAQMMCVGLASSSLIVDSPAGKFQGQELTAKNKQAYVSFQGIPYAKPPLGELRFAKPQPLPKLEGTFDATVPIVQCPQPQGLIFLEDQEPGQEDCLILNIFLKNVDTSQKNNKKVLIFIHGGGFVLGSARDYDAGSFVTEQDVIMVTVNYRLGVLGFMSTENEASPGNYGMWDQTLALKWVKDNIAFFGGDPDDVTISGESAGSASVAILSITPVAKGLFTKAFPMSGTSTSVFGNAFDAQFPALTVAKAAECWNGETDQKVNLAESQAIVKCLREVPLTELTKFGDFSITAAQFVPRVDGEFIPDQPSKLIKDDRYLESVGYFDRSYLFGIDNNEFVVMDNSVTMTEEFIMGVEDKSDEEKLTMVNDLLTTTKKFYIKSRLGIEDPSEDLVNKILAWYDKRNVNTSLADMMTDLNFLIPTYDYMDALAKRNSKNVHFFYFNHYPDFLKGKFRGMPHGLDLVYWFDMSMEFVELLLHAGIQGVESIMGPEEMEVKASFSALIADFVKTNDPGITLRKKNKLLTDWPAYDIQGSHYLDFSSDPIVRHHLGRDKKNFWAITAPLWASELGQHTIHTEL